MGINGLLSHLENDGDGSTVQPWVWIVLIIVGPLAQNILFQLYIYFSVRTPPLLVSQRKTHLKPGTNAHSP